jgi:hypothetical protein
MKLFFPNKILFCVEPEWYSRFIDQVTGCTTEGTWFDFQQVQEFGLFAEAFRPDPGPTHCYTVGFWMVPIG